MIKKNKFTRYVLYALGEISLVMFGILLALQVNNWNESRKQANTEKDFKEGIKNDLKQDKQYISLIIDLADAKIAVYRQLNQNIFELYQTDRLQLDTVVQQYFSNQRTFYPISGSFESAVSGNELGKFKDKVFSAAVTKLYNSIYERLMDNAQNVDERWFDLTKKYSFIRRTGHLQDMNEAELNQFLNDIHHHNYGLEYYRNILSETLIEIDKLLLLH